MPLTRAVEGDLELTTLAFAPVAADGETAPLAPWMKEQGKRL